MANLSPKIVITRSNPIAPDARAEKIGLMLKESDCDVTLFGWDRTGALPKLEKTLFGTITRIRVKADYCLGLRLIPKLFAFWTGLFFKLLATDYDIIHACDFDTVLPALAAAKIKGKKIVYDILDFYHEGANVPTICRPIIRLKDRFVMHLVNRIIVVDENRLQFIPEKLRDKTEVIYNVPPDFKLHSKASPNHFRVVYTGFIHPSRYITEVATAVNRLKDTEMIIAGFGSENDTTIFKNAISNFKTVSFAGKVTYEKALNIEATANVIVALYDPEMPQNKIASSNKLFEAMMLGKPIIVNSGTSMDEKVEKHKCGIVIPVVSVKNIEQALFELKNNPNMGSQLGKNGRKAYEEHFSWNENKKRLAKLYENLVRI